MTVQTLDPCTRRAVRCPGWIWQADIAFLNGVKKNPVAARVSVCPWTASFDAGEGAGERAGFRIAEAVRDLRDRYGGVGQRLARQQVKHFVP